MGIEPTAIGLKGQRSTIWAKKARLTSYVDKSLNLSSVGGTRKKFPVRELNPGLSGESRVSWPPRLTGINMLSTGIEPATLGLWDLRAANCATKAIHVWQVFSKLKSKFFSSREKNQVPRSGRRQNKMFKVFMFSMSMSSLDGRVV